MENKKNAFSGVFERKHTLRNTHRKISCALDALFCFGDIIQGAIYDEEADAESIRDTYERFCGLYETAKMLCEEADNDLFAALNT